MFRVVLCVKEYMPNQIGNSKQTSRTEQIHIHCGIELIEGIQSTINACEGVKVRGCQMMLFRIISKNKVFICLVYWAEA